MCYGKYWKVSCCIFLKLGRKVQLTSSRRPEKTSVGRQFCTFYTNAFSMHYFQSYFIKCVPEILKIWLLVHFHSFREMSQRCLINVPNNIWRMTFSGRPQDIIFESKKRITVATFSTFVHQMYVLLDTKKLVMSYSFSFGETS